MVLLLLLVLGCAHRAPTPPAYGTPPEPGTQADARSESSLRAACDAGEARKCTLLSALLEMEAFGTGRSREAFEVALAADDLDALAQAVLIAEDRRDVFSVEDRVRAWQTLCGSGFLPGCEVGAQRLFDDAPEVARDLAQTGCEGGWAPSCEPLEPVEVELPADFAGVLADAGLEFRMPRGFVPAEPGNRSSWAIATENGDFRVGYLVMDDSAIGEDGRPELYARMAMISGANETGLPPMESRGSPFPQHLVRVEYNANLGGTIAYLSGRTQVMVVWLHRDPGTSALMVFTFEDADVAAKWLPLAGHSLGFADPIGLTGSW